MPANHHERNLHLPVGQGLEGTCRLGRVGTQRELLCDLRTDVALTGTHTFDGTHHLVDICALGQVAGRADVEEFRGIRLVLVDGHRDDPHVRVDTQAPPRCLQTTNPGHLHVHQHDLRFELADFLDRLLATLSLADDLDTVHVAEQSHRARPHQMVVVHNKNPDHVFDFVQHHHLQPRPTGRDLPVVLNALSERPCAVH